MGVTAVLVLLVATGCVNNVEGTPRPAPGLRPRPLGGQAVRQVLLNDTELYTALRQSFQSEPNSPPRFGGRDLLFDINFSPHECGQVVEELQQSAYGSADVTDVGRETWWNAGGYDAKMISVTEAVVALRAAPNADALFADASSQWQRCDGADVTWYTSRGEVFLTAAISDVRAANSVLSANVQTHLATTRMNVRALGVRVNCLLEVEVDYFGDQTDNSAVNIVHRMMDKVSGLT